MKKIMFIPFLILVLCSSIKAQQQDNFTAATFVKNSNSRIMLAGGYENLKQELLLMNAGPEKDYDFYKHRSKNQRIVGWATLGGGLLLGVGGILAANSVANNHTGHSSLPGVLFVASAAAGVVSIPFMIMAGVNKRKANALIKTQNTGFDVPPGVSKTIVMIAIQIPLGS